LNCTEDTCVDRKAGVQGARRCLLDIADKAIGLPLLYTKNHYW
jgi:hypothetical protein